ncbi:hypothetical protein U9M48_040976 [Paspalum notatum var. saurae]|uniref:Uncharacterized protein n=1 Tax=Paspalum notatum var. saurae TaxID=547442 RepID=A0AAQ3UPD7_PASNO
MYLMNIDLSKNNFYGQIAGLINLNFSWNYFTGNIPDTIGTLRIPTGHQLDTLDMYDYIGNPGLCGSPLPKKCPGYQSTSVDQHEDGHYSRMDIYFGLLVGFVMAFGWSFCGLLLFKKKWEDRNCV